MSYYPVWYYPSGSTPPPPDTGDNPDILAALVSYWGTVPDLTSLSASLHYDAAPEELDLPYAVLSEVSSKDGDRNTGRGYKEVRYLQFAVYSDDMDDAVSRGKLMKTQLDGLQEYKLTFTDGTQRAWFWSGQRLMKMPGRSKAGRNIWQQSHTYKATIGQVR